jgi:hypothetical protein
MSRQVAQQLAGTEVEVALTEMVPQTLVAVQAEEPVLVAQAL